MTRLDELRDNLAAVREQIARAEAAAGRQPGSVQLLPVTKFHPAEDIALLGELGITEVAENREQEARAKSSELPQTAFHMVGQIQSKKTNAVARWAAAVHSVDSLKVAEGLNRGMELALEREERTGAVLPCFLQLSEDADTSRGGVARDDVDELAEAVESAAHLELAGIMVVPPLNSDASEVFDRARGITDRLGERYGRAMKLSAGMSGDFERAIASGSDVVRVGTGVLGTRPVG